MAMTRMLLLVAAIAAGCGGNDGEPEPIEDLGTFTDCGGTPCESPCARAAEAPGSCDAAYSPTLGRDGGCEFVSEVDGHIGCCVLTSPPISPMGAAYWYECE